MNNDAQTIPRNVQTLLKDILDWMGDNDYECGPQGSVIYDEISKHLDAERKTATLLAITA